MSKSQSYFDVQWLQMHNGLTIYNAIEYFYSSPFYNKNSNNENVRYNTINNGDYINKLKSMKGMEFIVDENVQNPPHLYVIKQQYRKSPEVSDLIEC